MQLVYEASRARWEAITRYGEGDAPRAAGFCWNRDLTRWSTYDAAAANKLRSSADEATRALLDTAVALASEATAAADAAKAAASEAAVAASRATDADMEIPVPDGLAYLGYQKAGIAYATARKDTLIADEPGLGKTIQALGLANTLLSDAKPVVRLLVVGPKIALWNWRREAEKWLVRPHRIALWTSKSQPDADVVIVNYDVISRPAVAAALRAQTWDIAVFDEAHALKNEKAARTKACLGSKKEKIEAIPAARRLFLTGTPILNRPVELYPILHAMRIPEAALYIDYAMRYCEGRHTSYGYDASGASNLDELQAVLREKVMVRRLKADVLTELPAKRYAVVELEADTADLRRAVVAEVAAKAASDEQEKRLRAAVAAARRGGNPAALKVAIDRLSHGMRVAFTEMSRLRHATAVAKVPQVIEHVSALLDGSDESVLVMAHHADVIAGIVAGLAEAGHEAAVITGDTSDADRQRAQDDVQARRKRVFVGSMRACGVAITLTAASTVVFGEQDWTPGIMQQAEDRAHRIGQDSSVLVQHLVVDGSIDASMAKAVSSKGGVISAALDDTDEEVAQADEAPTVEAADDEEVFVTQEQDAHPEPEAPVPEAAEPVEAAKAVQEAVVEPEPEAEGIFVTQESPAPAARRPRGRPRIGADAMPAAERMRRWRERHRISGVEVPAALADRIRRLRAERGETKAQVLAAALAAIDTA